MSLDQDLQSIREQLERLTGYVLEARATIRDARAALEASEADRKRLRAALDRLLALYLRLANSGDAGNWEPETEPEVIAARQALILSPEPPP